MSPQEFFSKVADKQRRSQQTQARVPEPTQVMDHDGSVNDYRKMMKSNITANYAMTLDLIHRTRESGQDLKALDLCCGPGHISICLSRHLGYSWVKGLDLSAPMIDAARENAKQQDLPTDAIRFAEGDVTHLANEPSKHYDLVSFTNAAHHFPDLEAIRSVLAQAERVTSANGLIFLSDLARLKTPEITEEFAAFIGAGYGDYMRTDFLNSLRAAWLPDELMEAVPASSTRNWYSLQLGGVPFFQALIGLPEGRAELFLRKGMDWQTKGFFPDAEAIGAWQFMSESLSRGITRRLNRGGAAPAARRAG